MGDCVQQWFRCRRCLYPNTKPDLWFDSRGICSACLAFDARASVDWAAKQAEFFELVRSNSGKSHDVIVAVSGGKDSHWQVIKCLELGIRPLAVCATTDHLTPIGRRNLDNIANLCDLVEVTPHKPTRKKISKFALMEVGDISWCEHHLIWSVPAREAVARQIPIVLYGECPQNEYGAGPAGSETQTRLTQDWVHEFGGLLGLRLSDLSEILGIEPRHLELYRYPDESRRGGAVFMGAYFDWNGRLNAELASAHGFKRFHREVEGSWGDYENLDNYQTGVHDILRWLKFGYSRADDILSSLARRGLITRDFAVGEMGWTVRGKRCGPPDTYLGLGVGKILAHIDVTTDEWRGVKERFTNKELVAWASRPESYQCFSGTGLEDASREDDSTTPAASVA